MEHVAENNEQCAIFAHTILKSSEHMFIFYIISQLLRNS